MPWAFPDGPDQPTINADSAFIVATSTGGVSMVLGTEFICWLAGAPNPVGPASGTRVALSFEWAFSLPSAD